MACHDPSHHAQMTAAPAALFCWRCCQLQDSPLKSALQATITSPQQVGSWAWAKTLVRCFVRRSLFRRLDPTSAWVARINICTKSNCVFINHVDFIEDFCPVIATGHWSSKNIKSHTLTGANLLDATHTNHEPSKDTDPTRN